MFNLPHGRNMDKHICNCFNYIAGFEKSKAYYINRLILLLFISQTIYSSVAVHVKRCHDIDRSG